MAPSRTIVHPPTGAVAVGGNDDGTTAGDDLFLEPMMGTPLAIYVEKDVVDRDAIVELITRHGGQISPGYSGVPYILVDPHKESGQSLYRQYAGKKGKIVLDARWVQECVRARSLQTFHQNWAGCKVTGTETLSGATVPASQERSQQQQANRRTRQPTRGQPSTPIPPPPTVTQQAAPPTPFTPAPPQTAQTPAVVPPPALPVPTAPPGPFPPYTVFTGHPRNALHTTTPAPPQTWQAPNGIAPHQPHINHPQPVATVPLRQYSRDGWDGQFAQIPQPDGSSIGNAMGEGAAFYDNRYRENQQQPQWPGGEQTYYENQTFQQQEAYVPPQVAGPSTEQQPPSPARQAEKRGRKRTRNINTPAPPASTLVLNRRHPPARSPTPPTRIIKSTYGGNLFTADDVMYLKKYIDYCQDQGLVLSLREICERIAVKAPHHTFYSWRRYCNKHQIRLGGYALDNRSESPGHVDEGMQVEESVPNPGQLAPTPATVDSAERWMRETGVRNRSPTPPRALFRSTTGKGVAFTDEDVSFLVKFLAHRRLQGRLDMVTFWKDVAAKAPHHSRASWMKYYRRHKHELHRNDGEPLPAPPSKKMRYGKNDDVLLAQYFAKRPEGTSDSLFQAFAKEHPHHPWKGWQEHHRIHKAKIDHLIQRIQNGEAVELEEEEETA